MRSEKYVYNDDLPINISVKNIRYYPPHYHEDIEILLVLHGDLNFRNGPFNYKLTAGDIFTNNRYEVHSMKSTDQDNAIVSIKISNRFFTRFFPTLSTSTYMYYSDKDKVKQQEHLKLMILSLVDKYLKKGYNYKQQCIDDTFRIIEYLNENFNVFGFTKNQLTKFESSNIVTIQRIRDIIHYTYENHSSNISLDDLAELEHLNKYYLSHLIKDSIGISFTQFLYFVRVEWSEVNLINSRKKISEIARNVGFSSTNYYRKYFKYWFGDTPENYRKKYAPLIKNENNLDLSFVLNETDAIYLINSLLSQMGIYDSSTSISNNKNVSIKINNESVPIKEIMHQPRVLITMKDFNFMHFRLFKYLYDLNCQEVILQIDDRDNAIEVVSARDYFLNHGFRVTLDPHKSTTNLSHGFDSIASMFYMYKHYMLSDDGQITLQLRDQCSSDIFLSGQYALLTSAEIPKPSYYAFQILSMLNGELLSHSQYHTLIKVHTKFPSYLLLTMNFNESIEKLCTTTPTIYEVKSTIDSFIDELNISVKIDLQKGKYIVTKHTFDYYNNIFNFMSKLNFPSSLDLSITKILNYCTIPQTDIYSTDITDNILITSTLRGVGCQAIYVQRM